MQSAGVFHSDAVGGQLLQLHELHISEGAIVAPYSLKGRHTRCGNGLRCGELLPKRKGRLQVRILENIPDNDPLWWNRERAEYFLNQLSPKHLKTAKHLIEQSYFSFGTAFRRIRKGRSMAELRFDGIAGCLRTPRGGSGRQILFKAGHGKYLVRLLTPRECARLQGVPDKMFKIEARDNQALFGFGDAICVPVVRWIAENYLNPLVSELIRGRMLVKEK